MNEKPRRETLKIVGAIGATCAFPFGANELYAQVEGAPAAAPRFFTPAEFALISRLADLIIPATSTPGALAAKVPDYIDMVVSRNAATQRSLRADLVAFELEVRAARGKAFLELDQAAQIAILEPLCKAADEAAATARRTPAVAFFKAIKNLTADGFYTSQIGLIDELGYRGNMVHTGFPACTHEH